MTRRERFLRLRDESPVILPSLLLCDFANLQREVALLEEAGVKALHLDVMDGVFVPNLTYGMPIVEAFRRLTDLPLDVHLMIETPSRYIQQFIDAGADAITIHEEAVKDPLNSLQQIRELGAASGLAINPATPTAKAEAYLEHCDLLLVMSVDAGFGGQSFNDVALEKLRRLRELCGHEIMLEVDGGINESTISKCAQAGAELFVVGSAIFRSSHYGTVVNQLADLAQ